MPRRIGLIHPQGSHFCGCPETPNCIAQANPIGPEFKRQRLEKHLQNERRLNRRIVYMLEAATTPRRVDDFDLLHRIKIKRQRIAGRIDQAFLEQAIADGQPRSSLTST